MLLHSFSLSLFQFEVKLFFKDAFIPFKDSFLLCGSCSFGFGGAFGRRPAANAGAEGTFVLRASALLLYKSVPITGLYPFLIFCWRNPLA